MLNNQIVAATREDQDQDHDDEIIRDIYALTPPDHRPANRPRRREAWETSSHRSSSLSMASSEIGGPSSTTSTENFTSISREFNALVIAGSSMANNNGSDYTEAGVSNSGNDSNLARIGEENEMQETNPLAIVPDNYNHLDPSPSSPRHASSSGGGGGGVAGGDGGSSSALAIIGSQGEVSVQRVKREEVQSKISAWQTAKVAKINNRFKREEAVINGWESEQVQKATSWMKKVERKLEDKRARALEKMQNDIAKARQKAEEKRASAEAKRGTKAARVFEIANLMKAVGRAPAKRSFF